MSSPASSSSTQSNSWLGRNYPWLCAVAALVPLLVCWKDFSALFWFGDDWDLIDEMSRQNAWLWAWRPFGENFEPVFKLGWAAVVTTFHGSHMAMIVVLWLTHALMVLFYGQLLRLAGARWFTVVLCASVFGLASAHIETLGWSTQWCSLLGTMFMGASAWWFWRTDVVAAPWSWRVHGTLVLLLTASAFSFPRGVVSGAGLAAVCLLPGLRADVSWLRRFLVAFVCIIGSILSTAVIALFAQGNQRHLGGHGAEMVQYGTWYFSLSPLHNWLGISAWGPSTTLVLGLVKGAAIVGGLLLARGKMRQVLWFLLVIEVAYAVLLGIGRYHTGLLTSTSSRYQYPAFIATLPFIGVCVQALLDRIPAAALRTAIGVALIGGAVWLAVKDWRPTAASWAEWRGKQGRYTVFQDPNPPATGAIPGVPSMSTQRAKELTKQYGLH